MPICDGLVGMNSPNAWDRQNPQYQRCHSDDLDTAKTRCINIQGCGAVVQDGAGYEPRSPQITPHPSPGQNTWTLISS
jgi:hypothetical protein